MLYDELLAAGCQLDSHESDLYVERIEVADAIIKKWMDTGNPTTIAYFVSQIDNKVWIEVPFNFAPFWRNKGFRD